MTTGNRIRAARKKAGLTQKQLGELCGIAEPTIRRYELGKLNPKRETLQKIAKPLGVRWYELYSDKAEEQVTEIDRRISEDIASSTKTDNESEFIRLLQHPVVFELGLTIVNLKQAIREYREKETGTKYPPLDDEEKETDAVFQIAHILLKNGIYPTDYKSLIDFGFTKGEAFSIMAACESGILQENLTKDQLDTEDLIMIGLDYPEFFKYYLQDDSDEKTED